jgi:hypothetical protein
MRARHVVVIALAFFVGVLASSIGGVWHPYATVKVKNLGSQTLSGLEVRFQNTEEKGTFDLFIDEPLKVGEETKFHFYVESEGAFALKAVFTDSKTVEGIGGYIERGDTKEVEIRTDRIAVIK